MSCLIEAQLASWRADGPAEELAGDDVDCVPEVGKLDATLLEVD
ncbi:hypothetical protein AB0I99_26185 [Streptomyces spongiicola]